MSTCHSTETINELGSLSLANMQSIFMDLQIGQDAQGSRSESRMVCVMVNSSCVHRLKNNILRFVDKANAERAGGAHPRRIHSFLCENNNPGVMR